MAVDANLVLLATTSASATTTHAALSIGATPRRGMKAHVIYKSGDTTGCGSFTWSITASYDASNFFTVAAAPILVVAPTAALSAGEVYIPFEVSPSAPGTPVQIKLVSTVGGLSGTSSTAIFNADIMLARPA